MINFRNNNEENNEKKKDYSIINSRSHQKKMAKNIADHIRNYFY